MPGKHLSHDEKRLSAFWNNIPVDNPTPYLRSIEITGGTGLRSIDGLIVHFRYPITAICGTNGVGKSTILNLAALANHSPENWYVHWDNSRPHSFTADRSFYTFSDFFVHSPGEAIPQDVSITWRFRENGKDTETKFTKSQKQWGYYSRRKERWAHYLSISRLTPPNEMRSLVNAFTGQKSEIKTEALGNDYTQYISSVLGQNYSTTEIHKTSKYHIQSCATSSNYTAFNMGSGETCIIQLMHLLESLPIGGLIVVEEIEAGLHPEAQIRLAKTLVNICKKKQLQIICSTHSETFLDALPRAARVLLKKSGNEHIEIEGPSTRYAKFEMTGVVQPELIIYCEDILARILITEALPHENLQRIQIKEIGSDANVIRQGVSHIRSEYILDHICILDGDCSESTIEEWIVSETGNDPTLNPNYMLLPGQNLPPEKWILEQLKVSDYQEALSQVLDCTVHQAESYILAMQVGIDHHDMGYVLGQRIGRDERDCIHLIMKSVAPRHPQLDELRDKIKSMLE